MKKNIAIPLAVLRQGDATEIAKFGPQDMESEDISQRNADAVAHADYVDNRKYGDDRAAAYPPIGEQLDVIWKTLALLNDSLPKEAAEMLARINAVKEQHPKPEGKK